MSDDVTSPANGAHDIRHLIIPASAGLDNQSQPVRFSMVGFAQPTNIKWLIVIVVMSVCFLFTTDFARELLHATHLHCVP